MPKVGAGSFLLEVLRDISTRSRALGEASLTRRGA